jgi:hypothetical protein
MEFPQEYWRQRTLFEIASAIGTPLSLDEATKTRAFGHYARILVDMDLSRHIFDEILLWNVRDTLLDLSWYINVCPIFACTMGL